MADKWTEERVLAEARQRTTVLLDADAGNGVIQEALAALMQESGWTEADYIEALNRDVARRSSRWTEVQVFWAVKRRVLKRDTVDLSDLQRIADESGWSKAEVMAAVENVAAGLKPKRREAP
jgi:hypothetical protein